MTNNIRKKKLEEIKKHNRMIMKKWCKITLSIIMITGAVFYHNNEINKIKEQKQSEIIELQDKLAFEEKNSMAYEIMYNTVNKQVNTYKQERDNAVAQYDKIKEQIKYSKLNNGVPNRGSYPDKPLTEYPVVTIDEMNEFIKQVSPSDSPFIGKGETFLKASQMSGLDPYYIFSHASLESGYGCSPIATCKNNYYGIAAYNESPDSAYHMGDNLDDGIINGAIWIRKHYIDKGYNTLNKMVYQGKYCLYDNGEPSDKWVDDISIIASKQPKEVE